MAASPQYEPNRNDWISIGRIRGTQGRRGEVAAEIKTDFPDRFQAGAEFFLARNPEADAARRFLLESAWFHKGQVILKFAGVNSISEAEVLSGMEVLIPRAQRRELSAGTYYLGDLIGCSVVDGTREIGRVADWEDTSGMILLHVEVPQQGSQRVEVLIPFAEEICTSVDLAGRVIRVQLPEGLLELNTGNGFGIRRRLSCELNDD